MICVPERREEEEEEETVLHSIDVIIVINLTKSGVYMFLVYNKRIVNLMLYPLCLILLDSDLTSNHSDYQHMLPFVRFRLLYLPLLLPCQRPCQLLR